MTTPSIDFNYSGDPATSDLDEVRFLVQDTDPSNPLLSDEEITYLINKWGPLYGSNVMTASVAATSLSRKFAGAVSISADGVSVSVGDLSTRYSEMAAQLRNEYNEEREVSGFPDISNLVFDTSFDPSIDPLEFAMRLNDNRDAGRQSYGGFLNGPASRGYTDPLYNT